MRWLKNHRIDGGIEETLVWLLDRDSLSIGSMIGLRGWAAEVRCGRLGIDSHTGLGRPESSGTKPPVVGASKGVAGCSMIAGLPVATEHWFEPAEAQACEHLLDGPPPQGSHPGNRAAEEDWCWEAVDWGTLLRQGADAVPRARSDGPVD